MASKNHSEVSPLLPKTEGAPEIQQQEASFSSSDEHVVEEDAFGRTKGPKTVIFTAFSLLFGISFFAGIFIVLFGSVWPRPTSGRGVPHNLTLEQRADKILTDTPLIDGHNDFAIAIRMKYQNHINQDDFNKAFVEGGMVGHVDLAQLQSGKVGGAFWSAWVPCPKDAFDFSDANYAAATDFTLTQLDLLTRLQQAYPKHFSTPPNGTTALSAFKAGQLISPLAIEGLHQIGNKVSNLRLYHSLGVRYATLTQNCHNIYADAAVTEDMNGKAKRSDPYWGGVSDAGKKLIHEMNRIGMIVDLAHVSVDTMRDVLGGTDSWSGSVAPIMFSHSSAYALCPHPRNVPDDILHLVKKRNSVVMINFAPGVISCVANPDNADRMPDFDPQNSTIQHVVEHIRHVGDLIGYDHVGLGSDFDGIQSLPRGLIDVSSFPELVKEMLVQGISDGDAAKIVGGNILRVWKDVDEVALRMQADGAKPLEDDLPPLS